MACPKESRPRVAEQQIEAQQRDGVAEERHQQVGVERRREDRHGAERDDGGDEQRQAPAPAHHAAGFPNRPDGLNSSTPMTIR